MIGLLSNSAAAREGEDDGRDGSEMTDKLLKDIHTTLLFIHVVLSAILGVLIVRN